MNPTDILTALYLTAFAFCAVPGIARIRRRRSSADLSIWRELVLLVGITAQFGVMLLTGADWRVWLSPILSGASIATLLLMVYKYRGL